jgi:CheY-like chemotaxis protein
VLLDLYMPELDGIETACRIRRRNPETVVLLLTTARRAHLDDRRLRVEDKRDLSPELLVDYWRQHSR